MKLKPYQQQTLAVLDDFFSRVREREPHAAAFEAAAAKMDRGQYATPYRSPAQLAGVPYVCLRIPTGGGKTLLAAHTVGHAARNLLERPNPLALWFVPSQAIRSQTVEALQNPRHPYRTALQSHFATPVTVWDIDQFNDLTPDDVQGRACVIVSTIQSLKAQADNEGPEGKERLRVYRHREQLRPFFIDVTAHDAARLKLDLLADGRPKASFINLLKMHAPLMIVDEAHGALTGLTRDLQQDIGPSAIVEFTATPRAQNNILVSVSASTLKDAHIIKLPIILGAHKTWQDTVARAVAERNRLATLAAGEREYIRPIILFQAQNVDGEVTHETLKKHLREVENIPAAKIRTVTGSNRELDDLDLMARDCAVEHVITVQALKEGWDCPFAYVFCSLANIRSNIAIEQLLGRVMRMPYAALRQHPELNCAYAHVVDHDGWAAASNLKDRLVDKMGFADAEAQQAITTLPLALTDGGLLPLPPLSFNLPAGFSEALLPEALRAAVTVIRGTGEGEEAVLQLHAAVPREAEAAFVALLPTAQHEEARRKIVLHRAELERRQSPAERGQRLELPVLHVWLQGELLLAEPEVFLTDEVWDLSDTSRFPPRLMPTEFDFNRDEQRMALDVAQRQGREVMNLFAVQGGGSAQGELVGHSDLSATSLANWLGVECQHRNVHPVALHKFCLDIVTDQLAAGHTVMELGLLRYRLARAISSKVTAYLQGAQTLGYSRGLFGDAARVEVRFDEAFRFPRSYPLIHPYTGSFRFQHHFYGPDSISKLDAKGEEFDCARALDGLAGLDTWVRNIDSLPEQSFRLPLATRWFYPDFVARLKDGRMMVVEYKGALLDEQEKKMVGELWARNSEGRGLFVWVRPQKLDGRALTAQLRQAIG